MTRCANPLCERELQPGTGYVAELSGPLAVIYHRAPEEARASLPWHAETLVYVCGQACLMDCIDHWLEEIVAEVRLRQPLPF